MTNNTTKTTTPIPTSNDTLYKNNHPLMPTARISKNEYDDKVRRKTKSVMRKYTYDWGNQDVSINYLLLIIKLESKATILLDLLLIYS